ncbi:MAG: ABC transporter permease subunit, partial [Rhodoferax sp.]|nr:ABC transporter permease subunit [Rhodoferax sp.]
NLGIRLVSAELMEATEAFGASNWQKIWQVQLPLALPTIMGGVNQTIMLSLSMVVVASMIGVQGLGQPVLKAISNQYFTLGLFNGIAIVGIAIIFDRASQAYGKRLQRHSEVHHG